MLKIIDYKNNKLDIEISVNKVVDPFNSKLLLTYSMLDRRFHALALILKDWNKRKFKDKLKRLNSYSIVLMVIAFLQSKEVLPKL